MLAERAVRRDHRRKEWVRAPALSEVMAPVYRHHGRKRLAQKRRRNEPQSHRQSAQSKPGESESRRQAAEADAKAAQGDDPPWTPAEIEEAFRRFQAAKPEPKSELQHVNPFTLLVAVVLSAQATDAGVNKATPALFAAADTPEKMVALGEDAGARPDQDHRALSHQGEERHRAVAKLVAEHGGQVPRTREELEALPGVGRKTANVVLNIAFGEPTIAVDTHIFRVGNRTGLAPGKDPFEVEQGSRKSCRPNTSCQPIIG